MKKPLEIEVYVYGEDQLNTALLDIEIPIDECELRQITIFNIEAILPYIENEKEFISIHTGGTCFVSPYTYNEMKELLFKLGYYD